MIEHVVVRRTDDACSQRHELYGTKSLYEKFDSRNVDVRRHGHDRNASINRFIRGNRKNTTNQIDKWHVSVSTEKGMKKIASGAMCRERKTWSSQLADKVHPEKIHANYAVKNECDGSAEKLKSSFNNIVLHYQNIHENCALVFRCKMDSNYITSREILTSPVAIRLLTATIQKCDVYKHAEN